MLFRSRDKKPQPQSQPQSQPQPKPKPPTHEKDYDGRGQRIACRGTLLQKEPGVMSLGSRWQPRYCYCDENKLLIWKADKPFSISNSEFECSNPRHGFLIADCSFEESSEKRYAFSVIDNVTHQNIVLAAQDARQYEEWHQVFSRQQLQMIAEQARVQKEKELLKMKEDEKQMAKKRTRDDDMSKAFFKKHDVASNDLNPAIPARHTQHIMSLLDPTVSPHMARIALRELRIDPQEGCITLSEFLPWWKARNEATTPTLPRIEPSMQLHFASFLDSELSTSRLLRAELLKAAAMPSSINYSGSPSHPQIKETDNWNDVYQRLVEAASAQYHWQSHVTPKEARAKLTREELLKRRGAVIKPRWGSPDDAGIPTIEADFDEPDLHYKVREVSIAESISACRSLAQFQGEFIKEALAGAKLIVDEYILPKEEKTQGVIIIPIDSLQESLRRALDRALRIGAAKEGDGGEENDAPPVEEVYGYGGLLYRIAAVAATQQDLNPSAERGKYLAGADSLFHKLAGIEHRHLLFMQRAIARVHSTCSREALQARESEILHLDDDDHHEPATPSSGASKSANNKHVGTNTSGKSPGKTHQGEQHKIYSSSTKQSFEQDEKFICPSTLLSMVIDYGGFRITALCPTNIDETTTLVHGSSPNRDVFVDTYPEKTTQMLQRLGQQLNICTEKRVMHTVSSLGGGTTSRTASSINDSQNGSVVGSSEFGATGKQPREVDLLCRDLQVHECRDVDQRIYLVNLRTIMPSDLPRKQTNDLLTHTLRPEFVARQGSSLAPEALRSVNDDVIGDGGETRFSGDSTSFSGEYMSPHAHDIIAACEHLYADRLPSLAHALDELTCMPVDSFTLSKCFHLHGVSMRQLGVVYALCQHVFSQQFLLAEAVARCCKVLLNKALREMWRRSKAHSIQASARHKSHRRDFLALNAAALNSRRGAVLEIFNLALGSGTDSRDFWRGILSDIIFQKFSIELPDTDKIAKHNLLHLPQLSLAIQYHTGTILRDRNDYDFSAVESSPIKDDDILEFLLPSIKMPSVVPGEVGKRLAMGEALLSVELNAEAAVLLRLRQHLQQLQSNDSKLPHHSAEVCDTIYKIALSQFADKDYHGTADTLNKALSSRHRYSAYSARLVTLLMCAQFHCGFTEDALQTFEDGQERYLYALGDKHPAYCLHLIALADCYQATGHNEQALVMATLAQQVSKTLLGEGHLLTASYGVKVGVLSARLAEAPHAILALNPAADKAAAAAADEADFIKATLEESLRVLDSAAQSGAHMEEELSYCLQALMTNSMALDEAANFASRCVTLIQRVYHSPPYKSPEALSCLLTVAEHKARNRDIDGAIRIYDSIWVAVRTRPTDYKHVGTTFALIACRLLDTLLHSLALQTRLLLISVAKEVEDGLHGSPARWEEACRVVFTVLWDSGEGGAKHYFQKTVDGLIQAEIDAGGATVELKQDVSSLALPASPSSSKDPSGSKPQRRASNFAAAAQASFQERALEIGVMMRLIECHRLSTHSHN